MDIVQGLIERRSLFHTVTQMLIHAAVECDEKGMEASARLIYAAAYVQMEQMDQVDQALAAIDGCVTRIVEVDLVCSGCGDIQGGRAVINLLISEDEQGWEDVSCLSCDKGHIAHIRHDEEKIPTAFVLTIQGIVDFEKDERTNDERKPEAKVIGKGGEGHADELPPASELRATLYGETKGELVVVQHESKQDAVKQDIRAKLGAAKAKIGQATDDDDEEDF